MPKTGYRPTPIIAKLRETDVLIGQGKAVAEGVKALGVTEVTYTRYWQSCDRVTVSWARLVKKRENTFRWCFSLGLSSP